MRNSSRFTAGDVIRLVIIVFTFHSNNQSVF